MKTEFKDIMHLYLGCKYQVTSDTIYYDESTESMGHALKSEGDIIEIDVFTAPFLLRYGAFGTNWIHYLITRAKPILRPLSSMTDEEFKEAVLLHWGISRDIIEQKVSEIKRIKEVQQAVKYGTAIPYVGLDKEGKHYISATLSQQSLTPSQTIFFLKNSFDLFDLIESGQAIDATTLNP